MVSGGTTGMLAPAIQGSCLACRLASLFTAPPVAWARLVRAVAKVEKGAVQQFPEAAVSGHPAAARSGGLAKFRPS